MAKTPTSNKIEDFSQEAKDKEYPSSTTIIVTPPPDKKTDIFVNGATKSKVGGK